MAVHFIYNVFGGILTEIFVELVNYIYIYNKI